MAESFVQLNTDGVGKKIDTWTESTNNQHRQAMVIADPSSTLNVAFVTAANALKVDASATTQPISGSITVLNASIPVTQSGVWTIQPGNTANTTPWLITLNQGGNSATVTSANALKVDGSAVTQPVSGTVTTTPPANASTNLTQVGGSSIALGQAVMAASVPVVIASNQSQVEVELFDAAENGLTSQANGTQRALDVGVNVAGVQVDPRAIRALTSADTVTANQGTAAALASAWPVEIAGGSGGAGGTNLLRVDTGGNTVTKLIDAGGTNFATITSSNALKVDLTSTTANAVNINNNIAAYGGTATTLGQKVSASSIPMVLASDQSTINVAPATPNISTYTATITGLATATLATDIFTVTGSATKLVKIRRFIVSGSQTTAGSVRFITLKRSTANTAGTSTNPTAVPHDSNNAAATATVNAYTANPTTGTLVGNMATKNVIVEIAAATTDFQGWDFTQDEAVQPVALRGIAQVWAINLGGVTVAGSALNISVVWTEE